MHRSFVDEWDQYQDANVPNGFLQVLWRFINTFIEITDQLGTREENENVKLIKTQFILIYNNIHTDSMKPRSEQSKLYPN